MAWSAHHSLGPGRTSTWAGSCWPLQAAAGRSGGRSAGRRPARAAPSGRRRRRGRSTAPRAGRPCCPSTSAPTMPRLQLRQQVGVVGRRAEREHARSFAARSNTSHAPMHDEGDVGLAGAEPGRPLSGQPWQFPNERAGSRARGHDGAVRRTGHSPRPRRSRAPACDPRPVGAFLTRALACESPTTTTRAGQVGRQRAGDGAPGSPPRPSTAPRRRRRPAPAARAPRSRAGSPPRTAGRDVDRLGGRDAGADERRPTATPRRRRPRPSSTGAGPPGPVGPPVGDPLHRRPVAHRRLDEPEAQLGQRRTSARAAARTVAGRPAGSPAGGSP